MKLGISSYTYGWAIGVPGREPTRPLDEHGLLDRAATLGVKLVQICDNLPLHTFSSERFGCFKSRLAAERVEIECGTRGLTLEQIEVYAGFCRRLGARLLRFVIDGPNYQPSANEVSALLSQAVPMLEGLTLGIENHDRFPAAVLRSIIEGVGSDRIGVCLDTANSLGAGEGLREVVGELAPVTVNLHIKDFRVDRVPHLMGFNVTGCPAGSGFLNLPWLLDELRRHGRCKTAVLEQWPAPEIELEATLEKEEAWAVQSMNFLRPFFT